MKNLKKSINFIGQRNKVCHESWPEAYISFFENDPVIESGKKNEQKETNISGQLNSAGVPCYSY